MNAFKVSITVIPLFSLALTMIVKRADSVGTVGKLASSLGMYVRCLLSPAIILALIFQSIFSLGNMWDSNTI